MDDLEKQQIEINRLKELNRKSEIIYLAVSEFLNNFGKESALYPTRIFVQVEAAELQKLARVFYQ